MGGVLNTFNYLYFSSMNNQTLYALDFDGVICNSAVETAKTGWLAAQQLWPDLESQTLSNEIIEQFVQIRPCLEYGYEALLIVRLLHDGETFKVDCSDYQNKIQALIDDNAFNVEALKILFGRTRDEQIQQNKSAWLASNRLFNGVENKLKALQKQDWIIVTTKQERFVKAILDANGISIDQSRIFGLDRQLSKQQVLQNMLAENAEQEILFIEDRLPTLLGVQDNSALNAVRLQLVDWGYNTKSEREIAQHNHIEVISLENFLSD